MGYWAQTKRNFPLTLRTYPGSDSALGPWFSQKQGTPVIWPPHHHHLAHSSVLPQSCRGRLCWTTYWESSGQPDPGSAGSWGPVTCFCGAECQEGTSPREGECGISPSTKGMHNKHWLAVSRGKVASQKVSGFAQRNVCLSLAYCHHFGPHFRGFSPQGCGIPGASTALESQQVILTMETGWSLRTRNKKGGGPPFTCTVSVLPVDPAEPPFDPVANCCSLVCCLSFFESPYFIFYLLVSGKMIQWGELKSTEKVTVWILWYHTNCVMLCKGFYPLWNSGYSFINSV